MKKLGIIGGLGPQSTELFYHELVRLCQTRGDVEYPNILLNSLELWRFFDISGDNPNLINNVREEISKIQDHVDFIVSPCNSIHLIINEMRDFSKVPILAIHEEVVKEVSKSSIKKVGILGTKITLEGKVYQKELEKNNISFELIRGESEEKMNTLIFNKMLQGKNYNEMHDLLLKHIESLKERGCDGVILACTELPLFINQDEVDIKLFPSTNILARSAFEKIFE